MSIQDESFPCDNYLELSCTSDKIYVFPHHKPHRDNVIENKEAKEEHEDPTKKNTSLSSPLQNVNDSTQSSNDFCLSSETSGNTNASEPNELQESHYIRHKPNKSISYQDIHSEYTKRRFKHVESKVGQYIANMRAQDEKRRNSSKFQRHCSLPETLQGRETPVTDLESVSKKQALLCRSTNDLDCILNQHNDLQSDHDGDNYNNLTSTTSSLFTRDMGSENGIFLDKQTYEQLLSDKERKDYLQTKLEEKNAENWRLKQNLDKIRIEFSMCKDKLKQQTQAQRISGSFGSINAVPILGRTSLQSLLYPQATREKSTQTAKVLTPSTIPPEDKASTDMFATPYTPDSNNNSFDNSAGMLAPVAHKVLKSVATIQPISLNFNNLVDQDFNNSNTNTTMGFLRQRSNSLATRKKSTPLSTNISKISSAISSVPSSSDSAIDIEVAESPKSQRQSFREELIYYEQPPQRCAVVENSNDGQNITDSENNTTETGVSVSNRRKCRKRRTFRSRLIRFFGACTNCKDSNMSLEVSEHSQQSQIPLLKKSPQNYCPNVR